MDKSGVSAIVVSLEFDRALERCLASLERQTARPDKVVVVINGGVESASRLDEWKNRLPLEAVVNRTNTGFAAPHVEVLKLVSGEWVAVLNSDAVAEADWIESMLEASRVAGDIGMVASSVLMAADPERIESLGLEVTRGGFAYLRRWGERWIEEPPREVFGPSGCAAMYRREALDDVGFFDPGYFAWYEDVDLAWRMRRRGWRCVAAPRARVHHGAGTGAAVVDKTRLMHRNRLVTVASDWTWGMIFGNIHRIALWDLLSMAKAAQDGKLKSALLARLDFVASLPKAMAARRRIHKSAAKLDGWLKSDREKARARGLLP